MVGGHFLDELFAINEHVLIEELLALALVEFELELIRAHQFLVQLSEGIAQVAIHIRLLVLVPGSHSCQLVGLFDC